MKASAPIALVMLAAAFAPGNGLAQERKSLVTTRLEVTGEVSRKLSLSVEDLRGLAQRRGQAAAGGYGGVWLTDLLGEADIRRDERHALRRTYVVATASDGYHAVFSWGELFNTPVGRDVLVAFERDGSPLQEGEGKIALVSLADEKIGPRHVKWLNRIDVRRVPE
ncbi:MAG TPA: molybdopterin-dependent oxidoreductase [Burkholderiales bacterium]